MLHYAPPSATDQPPRSTCGLPYACMKSSVEEGADSWGERGSGGGGREADRRARASLSRAAHLAPDARVMTARRVPVAHDPLEEIVRLDTDARRAARRQLRAVTASAVRGSGGGREKGRAANEEHHHSLSQFAVPHSQSECAGRRACFWSHGQGSTCPKNSVVVHGDVFRVAKHLRSSENKGDDSLRGRPACLAQDECDEMIRHLPDRVQRDLLSAVTSSECCSPPPITLCVVLPYSHSLRVVARVVVCLSPPWLGFEKEEEHLTKTDTAHSTSSGGGS